MVTIPKAEYNRLRKAAKALERAEDEADVAAYDRIKAKLEAGAEEMLPPAFARQLIAGENPIAVWRKHRGMTQVQLARAIGSTQGQISQLETGARQGALETRRKIARALSVTLDDLEL